MSTPRNPKTPSPGPLPERTFERARGCWNCSRWNNGNLAISKWSTDRQENLRTAFTLAQQDPAGEDAVAVVNIRRMVDNLDHAVAAGIFGICLVGASETDFVHHAYLCDKWNAAAGASLATEGAALDKLPEELKEEIDK